MIHSVLTMLTAVLFESGDVGEMLIAVMEACKPFGSGGNIINVGRPMSMGRNFSEWPGFLTVPGNYDETDSYLGHDPCLVQQPLCFPCLGVSALFLSAGSRDFKLGT